MKAITFVSPGGPGVLRLTEVFDLRPRDEQLLVRVRATGVNRADALQRKGDHAPPPGESEILGLELAGEVEALGSSVRGFRCGDRVFALAGGGGYAEKAVVDYRLAMGIPTGWSFAQAAAVPEVFFTAQETLFTLGELEAGETVLIHAAGSGVGTAGIQMARAAGARVLITAGSAEKIRKTKELGAHEGCNYKEKDFAAWVKEVTKGKGTDLIQDFVGAPYWERNLDCLTVGGRLVLVGTLGGPKVDVDLRTIMAKRLKILGSVLRARSLEEKIAITRRFKEKWLPQLAAGMMQPVIDKVFFLNDAAEAHRYMEANQNFGKIILEN